MKITLFTRKSDLSNGHGFAAAASFFGKIVAFGPSPILNRIENPANQLEKFVSGNAEGEWIRNMFADSTRVEGWIAPGRFGVVLEIKGYRSGTRLFHRFDFDFDLAGKYMGYRQGPPE